MRIRREHSLGVVVDIQERLFPHIHEHDALAQRCAMLIQGLQILDVPLIVTQQYTKGLGPTIPLIVEALGTYTPLEKLSFSIVGNPDVEARILSAHGHHVIVFGIETHVCVLQSVLDILAQGRQAIVVEDCVSSRRPHDKHVAIERMRSAGAVITTAESLLFELLEEAGTDTFKQISALVK